LENKNYCGGLIANDIALIASSKIKMASLLRYAIK